jgi:hypothetical protein
MTATACRSEVVALIGGALLSGSYGMMDRETKRTQLYSLLSRPPRWQRRRRKKNGMIHHVHKRSLSHQLSHVKTTTFTSTATLLLFRVPLPLEGVLTVDAVFFFFPPCATYHLFAKTSPMCLFCIVLLFNTTLSLCSTVSSQLTRSNGSVKAIRNSCTNSTFVFNYGEECGAAFHHMHTHMYTSLHTEIQENKR